MLNSGHLEYLKKKKNLIKNKLSGKIQIYKRGNDD